MLMFISNHTLYYLLCFVKMSSFNLKSISQCDEYSIIPSNGGSSSSSRTLCLKFTTINVFSVVRVCMYLYGQEKQTMCFISINQGQLCVQHDLNKFLPAPWNNRHGSRSSSSNHQQGNKSKTYNPQLLLTHVLSRSSNFDILMRGT